jgi:hypothetical protein
MYPLPYRTCTHIHVHVYSYTCIFNYIIIYINNCPLLSSSQQTGAPNFLTGGSSQGGFGRCNASCLPPAQPLVASSMMGAGIIGAALHTVDNSRTKGTNISFTLETWIRVPSACESTYTASANFVFVLASSGYAVALRANTTARVFWPLLFLTAAPPQRCVAGPLVLTDSTGAIGDGPGLLARYESEGALSCSWILAPGGGSGGGFQDVTLFFTEFLLTSQDKLSLASCFDIDCTSTTNSKTFFGATVPPPYASTTPVMRVRLTIFKGAWASSAGFTASYVGTPTLPSALPGLVVDTWHHVALSVTESGSLSLIINGTQRLAQQLLWIPAPMQNPLTSGAHSTAIGRGAPAWQNGGNLGQACLELDELRFWTESRKASDILDTMNAGCQSVAVSASARLAACYSFDAVGDTDGGGKLGHFFPDASQNQIPAFTSSHGSTHVPWCVNMDDAGKLRLDTSITYDWSANDMWGYCTSKPRLPGAGFDFNEAAIEEAASRRLEGTAAVLEHYPGCGDVPLR